MLEPKDHVELREILCRRHQDHCYYVTDVMLQQNKVLRRLQQEPQHHTILGAGYLTGKNTIDPEKIWAPYIRLALHAPFLFNLTQKNALQIGLGAGISGGFLETLDYSITTVELEPMVIHIAQQYFGIPSSRKHNIIHKDGFEYIATRSLSEEKFDYAFIDTSYSDDLHLFISPVDSFTTPEFVKNLKKHMNKECAVVVNTYSRHHELDKMLEAERHRHVMLVLYKRFFPSCFYVETQDNSLLFCSCKPISKMTQVKYDYFLSHLPPTLYAKLLVDANVREEW
ncbi:unnamed protein product [Bursaphelenchus okinawaensis]|uniref:PABS domain-containing protein n=1 Tax=Bursaphelenchus okinawaensis TaxID=465554 RepID=A0A811L149_9BILA|nr:unnamed protein product [Bursaphelenchus okinawaensis]CAG9115108.1 unnamed protein product [Bursaphelenchus okinawaensis]